MTIREAKRQSRMAEWVRNIQEQQGSGLSVHAWCTTHGYSEGRYYYWLRIVRSEVIKQAAERVQGAALVKVEPERLPSARISAPGEPTNEQTGITMRYGNAIVEFPGGTSIEALAKLLKVLSTP